MIQIEKEVPGGRQAEVVIAVIIPVVVDIEPVGVEVAHIDTVATGVQNLPVFIYYTGNRTLLPALLDKS